MGNRQRTNVLAHVCDRAEGHQSALLGPDVEHAERRDVALKLGEQLHDHHVLVVRREDGRHLPRSVRVVERTLDLFRSDAQRSSAVAVDLDQNLRVGDLEIAAHVLNLRDGVHPGFHALGRGVECDDVGALELKLVLTPGCPAADLDRRRYLHEDIHSGNAGELGTQPRDNLLGTRSFPVRLEGKGKVTLISTSASTTSAYR